MINYESSSKNDDLSEISIAFCSSSFLTFSFRHWLSWRMALMVYSSWSWCLREVDENWPIFWMVFRFYWDLSLRSLSLWCRNLPIFYIPSWFFISMEFKIVFIFKSTYPGSPLAPPSTFWSIIILIYHLFVLKTSTRRFSFHLPSTVFFIP